VSLPIHATIESGRRDATPARGVGERLAGVRVIAVDDEHAALDLMMTMLSAEGAVVRGAANAADALELVGRWKPEVLVLDIGLPGEDGYQLLRELRDHVAPGRGIPAIAVTGYARDEDRQRAIGAGFVAHIPKPFDPDTVIATVAKLAREAR
jgi:CheY-like chemotaxis protein